jgi:hypothetical protein
VSFGRDRHILLLIAAMDGIVEAELVRRIARFEIYAPKSGCRAQEFDADPLAFVAGVAEKYDSALLLFIRVRIGQDDHFAFVNLVLQKQETAVGIDDHGLADFAKFSAVVASALGFYSHFVKYAPAAAWSGESDFAHALIFKRAAATVNCTTVQCSAAAIVTVRACGG